MSLLGYRIPSRIGLRIRLVSLLYSPLDWTTKYLETVVVELNYLKVEVFNVLVLDSSFEPDVQEI